MNQKKSFFSSENVPDDPYPFELVDDKVINL
jgi:hypothetical protein